MGLFTDKANEMEAAALLYITEMEASLAKFKQALTGGSAKTLAGAEQTELSVPAPVQE